MNKIVTMAARNVRPGDRYVDKDLGGEKPILKVERVDSPDRVEVRITVLDTSTWIPSEKSWNLKLYHTIQVRKSDQPREFMSWEPCYRDTTGRKKLLPAKLRKLFGIA
jgi:hypothetical protein